MERTNLVIIIAALLLVGFVIAIIAMINRRKENRKPNYIAFFIIGICWIPLGISTGNYLFSIIGLLCLIVGLVNRKSWNNQPKWEELSPAEKKIKIALIIFSSLILILGIVLYFITRNQML